MGQPPVGPRLNKPASNFNNPVDRGRRSEGGNRSNTHVEANTETSRDRGSIPRVSTESPCSAVWSPPVVAGRHFETMTFNDFRLSYPEYAYHAGLSVCHDPPAMAV